jgi:hypothetical protein
MFLRANRSLAMRDLPQAKKETAEDGNIDGSP